MEPLYLQEAASPTEAPAQANAAQLWRSCARSASHSASVREECRGHVGQHEVRFAHVPWNYRHEARGDRALPDCPSGGPP
jgi:hypothetical protein